MKRISSVLKGLRSSLALTSFCALAGAASAQVETATVSPQKIYASLGGPVSFVVSYTGGEVAVTDLVVAYTANTTGASIAPFSTACIPGAFTPPYASANPNEFYINWEPSSSTYPANCGGAAAAASMATFNGIAAAIPGGSYLITVTNNASLGAPNIATNDVRVCQKPAVTSVTRVADVTEGSSVTFNVNFAAVPSGCGGFAIPVSLTGAINKGAAIGTNNCANVADAATTCSVIVTTAQNAAIDGSLPVTLAVTDSTAASVYVSSAQSATAQILDDEVGVSVAATVASASETGPVNGVFTFTRTGATAAALPVTSTITGTLPTAGNFSFAAGTTGTPCTTVAFATPVLTATIPVGASSCTVAVIPVDDAVVEGSQTVTAGVPVVLAPAVGTGSVATVTIADNDTAPVFSVAQNGACSEAATPVSCQFAITRDSGIAAATTVNFVVSGTATRGTDYVLKTGGCPAGTTLTANSISHPDGSQVNIDVCPTDDLLVETGGESVILTLTANPPTYTVATASQTQNIADDDSPQSIFAAGGGLAAEAGGSAIFTFTRTGGSAAAQAAALTVNIARSGTATFGAACTAGVDYTAVPSTTTLTFAAAANTADVTVTACQDTVLDPAETIIYSIAAPTVATDYSVGAPTSATATITDDELSVVVTPLSVTEGGTATFTVTCSTVGATVTGLNFTVTGADAGQTPSPAGPALGTLTCGTPIVVSVPSLDDPTIGNNRQLTFALTGPAVGTTGGDVTFPASTVASVNDNDQPLIVPTLGALGLGLMSLLLAGLVGFTQRRRAK